MARRGRSFLAIACSVALVSFIFVTPAWAAGKGSGNGGGGGGGGGETTLANNLSVPAIMIGGGFTGVVCPIDDPTGTLVAPSGVPLSGYPIDPTAYYYVQGVHKWQAQCYTTMSTTAFAGWGDNLTGDAALMAGHPIRVELGLDEGTVGAGVSMDGYVVVKLDPNALDRESAYGTLATSDGLGGFTATVTPMNEVRVYDAGMTFSIQNVATGAYVVQPGTKATAEINATGRVVYGYNLRVTTPGDYLITYTTPSVTLTGADAGTVAPDFHSVSLPITVGTGGGGGGGRGH